MTEELKIVLAKIAGNLDFFERPKDPCVYLVDNLVEAAYKSPQYFKERHFEQIKEFSKLVELIKYVLANPKPGLLHFHVTPGPEATVDSLAEAILKGFKDKFDGKTSALDMGDLRLKEEVVDENS